MTDDPISRAALLPCPFCGADAKLRGGPLAQETYSIWCSGTPSHHQDYGFDAGKAITAWNRRALPAAQVQAEPVAQEPVAWRVYGMMRQGAPNNVKARGIGSDLTEYLYPVHREADARECARLMRGEVQPLYSHPAATPPAPDDLDALVAWLHRAYPNDERVSQAADAITALRARPATVQVKPLAWKPVLGTNSRARCVGLTYEVARNEADGMWFWWLMHMPHRLSAPYRSEGLAKAAAEENASDRIRAALVASEPAPGCHQPPLPSEDAQGGEV